MPQTGIFNLTVSLSSQQMATLTIIESLSKIDREIGIRYALCTIAGLSR